MELVADIRADRIEQEYAISVFNAAKGVWAQAKWENLPQHSQAGYDRGAHPVAAMPETAVSSTLGSDEHPHPAVEANKGLVADGGLPTSKPLETDALLEPWTDDTQPGMPQQRNIPAADGEMDLGRKRGREDGEVDGDGDRPNKVAKFDEALVDPRLDAYAAELQADLEHDRLVQERYIPRSRPRRIVEARSARGRSRRISTPANAVGDNTLRTS